MSETENPGQNTSPSQDADEQGNGHVKAQNGEREPATPEIDKQDEGKPGSK
jgi:hypothetical protein